MRLVLLSFLFMGCATTNAWKTDDGKTESSVNIDYGVLTIKPVTLNPNIFTVNIVVENNSNEDIKFDIPTIYIKNSNGDVTPQLNDDDLNSKLMSASEFASIVANGSGYANKAVTSDLKNAYFSKMIKPGFMPPKSKKSGVIYFDGSRISGDLVFIIRNPTPKDEKEVSFFLKK